jgi:uncharacterized damage-inducible protein DinB
MNDILLNALRTRIVGVFPTQIRAAIAPLSDEQLWWRPNEASNSIGNLMLHLTGSIHHFLNRNLGGVDFTRDRAAEFAERRMLPKSEVLAAFDAMLNDAEKTFDSITPERLGAPSPEPAMSSIVFEDLMNVAVHIAAHAGQIVWIAKMLSNASLDDVWMKSHRSQGAWKKRTA